MSFSRYWRNATLNHHFGKAAYTAPAHIFVALSTANPGVDGSGLAEPSGGSYAPVETDPADWDTATVDVLSNIAAVLFPTPTGAWGTITHVALKDAAGGNVLASTPLSSPQVVTGTSLAPTFDVGSITVTQT
jgi:hypothetical protein